MPAALIFHIIYWYWYWWYDALASDDDIDDDDYWWLHLVVAEIISLFTDCHWLNNRDIEMYFRTLRQLSPLSFHFSPDRTLFGCHYFAYYRQIGRRATDITAGQDDTLRLLIFISDIDISHIYYFIIFIADIIDYWCWVAIDYAITFDISLWLMFSLHWLQSIIADHFIISFIDDIAIIDTLFRHYCAYDYWLHYISLLPLRFDTHYCHYIDAIAFIIHYYFSWWHSISLIIYLSLITAIDAISHSPADIDASHIDTHIIYHYLLLLQPDRLSWWYLWCHLLRLFTFRQLSLLLIWLFIYFELHYFHFADARWWHYFAPQLSATPLAFRYWWHYWYGWWWHIHYWLLLMTLIIERWLYLIFLTASASHYWYDIITPLHYCHYWCHTALIILFHFIYACISLTLRFIIAMIIYYALW